MCQLKLLYGAFIWYATHNILGHINIFTLVYEKLIDLCKFFPQHFVAFSIHLWKISWDMKVIRRYNFLCGLIRHNESCSDLYRPVARHHDSSSLFSSYLMAVELSLLSGIFCSGLVICKINFYFLASQAISSTNVK
jgi:hypothetical protein